MAKTSDGRLCKWKISNSALWWLPLKWYTFVSPTLTVHLLRVLLLLCLLCSWLFILQVTMFVKLLAVHFADSQCCPVCTQQVLVNGKSNVVSSDCLTWSICVSSSVYVSLLVCVSSLAQHHFVWYYLVCDSLWEIINFRVITNLFVIISLCDFSLFDIISL